MCLFCKIINNEEKSYTIYEDDIVKVFMNIFPNSNGHLLVVTKKHYENFLDIDLDTLNYINKIIKKMYILLKEKLNIDGLTISNNNELGQEIKHFHIHLIPRYEKEDKQSIEDIYSILKE